MALLEKIMNVLKNGYINSPPKQVTKTQAPAIEKGKIQKHHITGVSHYEKNLSKLAVENPDYQLNKREIIKRDLCEQTIYQYNFYPKHTELIPEPTNEYDPNAIKVVIDGEHVGYIKAGSCSRVLKMIRENRIEKIESKIVGGASKCVICHDDCGEDTELEKYKSDYSITIFITEK